MANNFSKFIVLTLLLLASMATISVSAYQFRVGGPRGWIEPTGNETETYDEWATRNRFHIGDSVYFKYKDDSVLLVDNDQYNRCNVTEPIFAFDDGNTDFEFDRYGFFYFISGEPGHCEAGQKLVVRVMVQSSAESPDTAPAPHSGGEGGGDGPDSGGPNPPGPKSPNSTVKLTVGSTFMVALGSVVVILFSI